MLVSDPTVSLPSVTSSALPPSTLPRPLLPTSTVWLALPMLADLRTKLHRELGLEVAGKLAVLTVLAVSWWRWMHKCWKLPHQLVPPVKAVGSKFPLQPNQYLHPTLQLQQQPSRQPLQQKLPEAVSLKRIYTAPHPTAVNRGIRDGKFGERQEMEGCCEMWTNLHRFARRQGVGRDGWGGG